MVINGKEIKINRKNAFVSDADIIYFELVKTIIRDGVRTHNRTGIDTIAIANYNFVIDMSKGYPILESKKVVAKNFASEIQWIHQVQSNEIQWLRDRDNPVWDLWEIDADGIYRIYEQGDNAINDPERMVPLKIQKRNPDTGVIEKIPMLDGANKPIMVKSMDLMNGLDDPRTIREAVWFGKEYAGTDGEAYGFINATYKKPQAVEWTLKNNPTDRRMNINLWQEAHLEKAVLPSCVYLAEFKVTPDGKLHMHVNQRSADVPLGLPFNIAQYALLLCMYAKACNLTPGTLSWHITDAHIYVNQLDGIKKQLARYEYMREFEKFIQSSTDKSIEERYGHIVSSFNRLQGYVSNLLGVDNIENMKVSQVIKLLTPINSKAAKLYESLFEKKLCFEHMLTREVPILELAEHDSIFDYSTDYVGKNDPYLKENPIGNKELVLKNYHPTPFISMPIAQ